MRQAASELAVKAEHARLQGRLARIQAPFKSGPVGLHDDEQLRRKPEGVTSIARNSGAAVRLDHWSARFTPRLNLPPRAIRAIRDQRRFRTWTADGAAATDAAKR